MCKDKDAASSLWADPQLLLNGLNNTYIANYFYTPIISIISFIGHNSRDCGVSFDPSLGQYQKTKWGVV